MAHLVQTPICHSTHSFEWCLKGKKATTTTCNKWGAVKNSLRRSSQFRQLEDKNKLKELVVVRNGRPVPSHFPCTLIKPGEQLIVRFVKASGPNQPMAPLRSQIRPSNQIVEFNVVTKGGKNITRILKNPELRSYSEVTVYGYKGEKVKHALERDGRFHNTVFEKTCALSETNTNVEMSNLVDDLGEKTFQIILLNKKSPPESQPSSLDESLTYEECDESSSDIDENELEVNSNKTENHLKQDKPLIHVIPGSKELKSNLMSLVSDYIDLTKSMFTNSTRQVSDVRNLLSVEYGRSQGSVTTYVMTELMRLKHSVCQVRIRGGPAGSGFLLFDTYVLTNYHVIKQVSDVTGGNLFEPVTVDFSFERLGQASVEHQVQEVVAFEYGIDESGHKRDWALLRLTADIALPAGLLPNCGFLPQSGTIYIIGHPQDSEKRVDVSSVLPVNQIIGRHCNENLQQNETIIVTQSGISGEVIQFVSSASDFINSVTKALNNTRDLPYDTCFGFGSSGSPVFDSYCNVVAMHSGGYTYTHPSGEIRSVIEYGHPLLSILENLIIQLVHKHKLDVLKQFLKFVMLSCQRHDTIMHNVKKLVDSRNDAIFKNTALNYNALGNDILKQFFEFICVTDSPVPMDISLTSESDQNENSFYTCLE